MSRRRAPTALRRPISRVRSVTDTSMMFITPMPPTMSEMPAIAPRNTVKTPVTLRRRRENIGLGLNGEVGGSAQLDLVQNGQLICERRYGRGDAVGIDRRHFDRRDGILIANPRACQTRKGGSDRNVSSRITAEAKAARALRLDHAHDLKQNAVDFDLLADRIQAAKQIRHHLRADTATRDLLLTSLAEIKRP